MLLNLEERLRTPTREEDMLKLSLYRKALSDEQAEMTKRQIRCQNFTEDIFILRRRLGV